ncbi:MAG: NAD-dependent epimerase/dehydratase family protein, partial [Methanomicrobiales archaeon]|nr:NAD-dependent epimerase/dehydratase family protein [Methanomicrobiales archaeon]
MGAVVTGGCGFIGSHLVDALAARGEEIAVIDNLSTGNLENLAASLPTGRCTFHRMDLNGNGWERVLKGAEAVYHLAADPDVRMSGVRPESVLRNNILATARVLEAMRGQDVPRLVFTSTSTVYGEAKLIPTPEDYSPLEPISVYAGSKLACEALISAYCHSYGMQAWVFRFANIIGERSNHGVIWDFIHKLRENPRSLEILGDGRQAKSYLEVRECVRGMLLAVDRAQEAYNVFNIGSEEWIDVKSIADIVVDSLGLTGVEYRFTGGDRGWVGDVPRMLLSIERLKGIGWRPALGSRESV